MGIRRRILLSFLALFAVVFVAAAVVSTLLIAAAVERRIGLQTDHLARQISLYPEFADKSLGVVKSVYRAKSARVEPVGSIPDGPGVFRAPLLHPDLQGRELVMVYSSEAISEEKTAIVLPFAVVAGAGLVLVLVLGTLVAQTIARPIEDLSRQARANPSGEVNPVGGGEELDHLVEAMNRMLAEVRRVERFAVMGRMAAGIAHEIRNPLSSMKMTVQMLREEASDVEPYDRLLREIERLELTVAEMAGSSQPLRKERVKMEGVVDDVLELMRQKLDHLSVRVEKRFREAPEVEVDVAKFKRCVMNLVLNGAQAMPSGGPLAVEVAPRDGGVRLSVTDGGEGVPDAVRARLFEPFVTTKEDGVGLGLALTRGIVEDHGGKIGFDAAPKGSTFWIELKGIDSSAH